MKAWQSLSALKRVKGEIELLTATFGKALETVIETPKGDSKQLKGLQAPLKEFIRVPGTLRLLEYPYLSLLANEILLLVLDSIKTQAQLESKELDLRLESAFVACTDLPALLEQCLRQSSDSFAQVSQLLNRLRKARGCAIIFSGSVLLEKDEVSFRNSFANQPEKMHSILARQADYYLKSSTALARNPADTKALDALCAVLTNLELMLRDHTIGVLWGLARSLVEIYHSGSCDKSILAECLAGLAPCAQQLARHDEDLLQAYVDEANLGKILNLISGARIDDGRVGIIKLWYNLDIAAGKVFRDDYRKLQVRYYNKTAQTRSLQQINAEVRNLIDNVNTLAEEPVLNRDKLRDIGSGIARLKDVLKMLRMHYLVDMVDASMSVDATGDQALALAAGVLVKINKELNNKLDGMEREVFSSDIDATGMQTMTLAHQQILQTANESLQSVILALDAYVDHVRLDDPKVSVTEHLLQADTSLDSLTCVLKTLHLTEQAGYLDTARDYVAWLLRQEAPQALDANVQTLAHLLVNSSWNLEQLGLGRDEAGASNLKKAGRHANELRVCMDSLPPQNPVKIEPKIYDSVRNRLMVITNENHGKAAPVMENARLPVESEPLQATPHEDDELIGIFAEEFDEVLDTLRMNYASLEKNSQQPDVAVNCQRAFHTLKGSGRMVGATVISKLAEELETIYERFGAAIDSRVLALTAGVMEVLPGLKQDFCTSGAGNRGEEIIAPLCQQAQRLLNGASDSIEVAAETIASAADVQPMQAETEVASVEPIAQACTAQEETVDAALLTVFLDEADELLQGLDELYLKWQKSPQDKTCLDEYLRLLHTIKGSSALVCEHELSKSAHDYETCILEVRKNNNAFDAAFFADCDVRLHALHDICRLYERDEEGHITRHNMQVPVVAAPQVQEKEPVAPQVQEKEVAAIQSVTPQGERKSAQAMMPSPGMQENRQTAPDELVRVSGKLLRSLLNDADEINFSRSRIENHFQDIGALLMDMDETLNRFKSYVKNVELRAREVPSSLGAGLFKVESGDSNNNDSNDNDRNNNEFDALEMDRYTELQETSLSLTEDYNDLQDIRVNLASKIKDIDNILTGQQRLTNSLQDGLITSQMVPFSSIVPRLGRLVRQVGVKLDKQVRFDVANQQGSLDKNILQAIITPLEHIVRNAIDHGIESAAVRIQQGKQALATLKITSMRQGASFRLEIRDDGRGIDVEKVKQQAVSKGLLADGADISDEEVYKLLFRPGFSTSTSVSSISGRGVGLDVVKSDIELIGGKVEIESVQGQGTAFLITLPLTTSLNRALVFAIGDTRYVVLMNTLDGVLVEKLASIHQKQQEPEAPRFNYGGNSYEYLYLGKLINESFKPKLDSIDSSVPLLLVRSSDKNYALHIDSIIESRDMVVKSISQQFASMPGIAGGVIMPDGNVAIVLDLQSLVSQYGQLDRPEAAIPMILSGKGRAEKHRKLVMVVDDSITVRKVTASILKRNGMDVITAKNGLEAVELLQNTVPDLILLDIEMPKMDGFEVALHVRAQAKPVSDIPIIMITSRIGDKHRNRAEAIGVNEYICKPFQEDNLLEYIRSY